MRRAHRDRPCFRSESEARSWSSPGRLRALLFRHAVRLLAAWMAETRAAGGDALALRMTTVGASGHAALAVGRGCDRSRGLLVAFRRGGLRARQAHGSAALRGQGGSRQQRRDNNAQDKTHDCISVSVFTLTAPRRGQFRHASDKGEECRHYVFAEAGYERTHRLINSPASSSARRPSASFAFHIGQAWIMCGQTCSVTLTSARPAARAKRTESSINVSAEPTWTSTGGKPRKSENSGEISGSLRSMGLVAFLGA